MSTIEIGTTLLGGGNLYIKKLTGEIFTIDFEYHDTIEDIKYRILDRIGLDPECVRLIFAGKSL